MIFTNVDTIVRRTLLERGLPIHYYTEMLFHTTSCIRQLSIDTLKIVNTVRLPINSYYAMDLPDDFVDDVAVSLATGATLRPIPKRDRLNPILNHDTTGAFVPYNSSSQAIAQQNYYEFATGWVWFWNVNDFGEPTGRFFGANSGNPQGYKVIKERRQLQFDNVCQGDAVLMYISDGQHADSATQVDTMAIDAIQAYNDWKSGANSTVELSPEGLRYINQKRILRARLDDLTVADVRNILHSSYRATIKN